MTLSPSDYKNNSLDPATRNQLFKLFVESKFAEYDKSTQELKESTQNLKHSKLAEWGEHKRELAKINEQLEHLQNQYNSLLGKIKHLEKPKSWWPF